MNASPKPPSYLAETRAIVSSPAPLAWLTTLDHKRLGVLHLVVSGLALVAAQVLSVARQGLAASTVFAFLFLTPSLAAALGTFFLPLQLGQKTSALPRVSLAGFWLSVLGAGGVIAGLVATGGGKPEAAGLAPMLAGAVVVSLGAALSAIDLLATTGWAVFRGLSASRLPLFAWSVCATSLAQILAAAGLLGVVAVLGLARIGLPLAAAATDFEARLLAHPWADLAAASTLMIVPAVGITSDIVATFAGKRPATFGFAATNVSALAWLGLVVWASPIFVSDDDAGVKVGFTLALVTIPLATLVLTWLATLYRGSISLAAPMLWALGCLFQVSLAAPASLLLGLPPTGAYLHGTLFEVGYRQYLFTGVPLLGFFGGLSFFWPKITGKLYDERLARIAFALVFLGLQVTYVPQMAQGLLPASSGLDVVSTFGSYGLAAGTLGMLLVFAISLLRGAPAPDNPWAASGLEWSVASPPPLVNFIGEPDDGRGPVAAGAAVASSGAGRAASTASLP
jgi:cytochrome c oxidase subunit 1